MSHTVVRADYEQLLTITRVFEQQSAAIEAILRQIATNTETLRGGDWRGQGATAFFAEMDGQVLPMLKRLKQALSEAARTTGQINTLMQQTEQDVAAVFQLVVEKSGLAGGMVAGMPGPAGALAGNGDSTSSSAQVPGWPRNMGQLYSEIAKLSPQNPVKVLKVGGDQYIVLIRGTDSPLSSLHSENWGGAIDSGLTGYSDYIRQIKKYIEATVPPGAVVHLVGHSQAGNSENNLADDGAFRSQYKVATVTTFGSAPPPFQRSGTDYYSIANPDDPVPYLDRTALTTPAQVIGNLRKAIGGNISAHLSYDVTAANMALPSSLNIQQWSEVTPTQRFDWKPDSGMALIFNEGAKAFSGDLGSAGKLILDAPFELSRWSNSGFLNNVVIDPAISTLPEGLRNTIDHYRDRAMDYISDSPPPSEVMSRAGSYFGQVFGLN